MCSLESVWEKIFGGTSSEDEATSRPRSSVALTALIRFVLGIVGLTLSRFSRGSAGLSEVEPYRSEAPPYSGGSPRAVQRLPGLEAATSNTVPKSVVPQAGVWSATCQPTWLLHFWRWTQSRMQTFSTAVGEMWAVSSK